MAGGFLSVDVREQSECAEIGKRPGNEWQTEVSSSTRAPSSSKSVSKCMREVQKLSRIDALDDRLPTKDKLRREKTIRDQRRPAETDRDFVSSHRGGAPRSE